MAAAAAAAGLACEKSAGSTRVGFSKCIEDWPSAGGPHPVKPSLAVDAPKLLWTVDDFNGSQATGGRVNSSDGGPVLSKNRLALQAGQFIYFLNKDGTNPQAARLTPFGSFPSGLVADLDGNIYFVAQDGVVSADANGNKRWQGGDGEQGGLGEFGYYAPPVLGPDGVVYAVTSNQRVFALRTQDGSTIWSQAAPRGQCCASRVLGGAGRGLFLEVGGQRIDVLESGEGRTIGTLRVAIDGKVEEFSAQWGAWVLGWDFGIASNGTDWVFDACGNLKWSKYDSVNHFGGSGLLARGDLLVAAMSAQDGTTWKEAGFQVYDISGNSVASATNREGIVLAVGGDDTIYTVGCANSAQIGTPATNWILAYSSDLKELWRFDLGGGSCLGMTGNVVLDEDGVMYLMRSSPNSSGTQVMAIQTRSPGLADSSWPSWRHDNRGTAWLVPGTVGSTTPADAAVSDGIDVPVETGPGD